ncbi:MAG: molybdopterin-guanine dinucleotide biosynthesis protein B [Syntrophales bacterium]|nr:molybdopterin-guanine dinucleotide biosynthesis protein B [Syntrophales bacterium]
MQAKTGESGTIPVPVVAVVGKSNSGKTTVIEGVIGVLVGRGWRVGTIKHSRHGFTIDHEGKDSWRHRRAGARITVLASPRQVAVVRDTDGDLEIAELCGRFMDDVDIVIVEGFKVNPFPKIEVYRSALNRPLLYGSAAELMAVMSDVPLDVAVPCLNIDRVEELADLIEARFLPGGKKSGRP